MSTLILKKLKTALLAVERHHLDGLDTNDQALAGEISHKAALAETRRSLESARAHLDDAFAELKKPSPDDDDAELAWSKVRRRAALGKLDAANVGRVGNRAPRRPILVPPPAARGGGAHLTAQVREDELKRLAAAW